MIRSSGAWAGALLAVLFCTGAVGQTKPVRNMAETEPPRAILWIANSFFYYNNSMHNHYGNLVRAAAPKFAHVTPR